jgi:hypothetical protein
MMAFSERFGRVEAVLVERQCGGWLAVSAPGAVLRIGVEGISKEDAGERFVAAVRRWTASADEPVDTQDSR